MQVTGEPEWEADYPHPTHPSFPSKRRDQEGRRPEFRLNKTLWPSGWRTMLLSAPWRNKVYFNWNSAHLHASPVILHKECTIVNFQFPLTKKNENLGFLWGLNGMLQATSSIACYTVGNHFMIGVFIITACDVTFQSAKKTVKSSSSFLQNSSNCKSSIKWCGLWRNSSGLIVAFPFMDYVISSTVFTFWDLVSSSGFFLIHCFFFPPESGSL